MTNFYEEKELKTLGFKFIGENCKISRLSSFYNKKNISIGNNTRIDDFCVLSAGDGGIFIGNNTHISTHVTICGKSIIIIGDYCCVSFKSTITSNCDDFTGEYMANPTLPSELTNVHTERIEINNHVIIGAYSFIMPGVFICENVSLGAFSFVKKNIEIKGIYCGNPLRYLKNKSNKCIILSNEFENKIK